MEIIQLEDGWNSIKSGAIDVIVQALDDGLVGFPFKGWPSSRILAYTTCYDMCTQSSPNNWSSALYTRHGETIQTYLRNTVIPALQEKSKQGGIIFLNELKYRWNNHQIMNKLLKSIFTYLDRYHVKHHGLPTLENAGLQLFQTEVYQHFKEDITKSILMLIEQECYGDSTSLYDDMVKLYQCMRMGSSPHATYATHVEAPFLETTRAYYQQKREEWIAFNSIPDYLIRVKTVLEEVPRRVADYLHPSAELRIRAILEHELIFVGFVSLLGGFSL